MVTCLNKFTWNNPSGFVIDFALACRLHKSLYGLKQAPRAWYAKIDNFFINIGFKCCESNQIIYVLHVHGDAFIVAIYVDDLIIINNNVWSNSWIRAKECIHFEWKWSLMDSKCDEMLWSYINVFFLNANIKLKNFIIIWNR